MRLVPERSAGLTFVTLIVCFLAGPFLGLWLGGRLAPDSDVAQLVSVFAFPVAFFAGLLFWQGLGILSVVVRALGKLLRGRLPSHGAPGKTEALVPPGYGAFVVFSLFFCGGAGLVAGIFSALPLVTGLVIYSASGFAYGLGLWFLAHHGYLPFPEPG